MVGAAQGRPAGGGAVLLPGTLGVSLQNLEGPGEGGAEESGHSHVTAPILVTAYWELSPLAGGCGPSGPKPPATCSVSSPLQLGSLTGPGTATPTD
jgi:hypothetical protein